MKLTLAIIWTIALVSNIISYAMGNPASWVSLFCAEGLLVFLYWAEWAEEKFFK